jgi:integrase
VQCRQIAQHRVTAMKQTQVDYAQLAQQLLSADKNNNRREITALVQTFADAVARTTVANIHYLRDGELVVYRRARSRVWQCRFKLYSNTWYRVSTRKTDLEFAKQRAGELFDEARYRERLGIAVTQRKFSEIARATVAELNADLAAGTGKKIYADYIGIINKYFVPFFGERYLQNIKHRDVAEFERWRNERMGKRPKSSTLMNFASAFNRVVQTAVTRAWISERVAIPKLSRKGERGQTRPAFSAEDIERLRGKYSAFVAQAKTATETARRELLCDYVEVLLLTGMRHGTESKGIQWRHCEWHEALGVRYMRIYVSGKTGPRYLIGKHELATVLQRLHKAQAVLSDCDFDSILGRESNNIFQMQKNLPVRFFNDTFAKLLEFAKLTEDRAGQSRTLYSLRHTYATQALLDGTDIHTLAKQMGTSVRMLELHYSKLTATMAAERLA